MLGIVDVGGGMRGAYTAGVYDRLLTEQVDISYCLGVSAGSANLITYLAKQQGRNLRFYTVYSRRKAYMSVRNFIQKGSYLDMDYIYGTMTQTGGEDPLDYDTFEKNPAQYVVACTDAQTGEAVYFTRAQIARDDYGVIKASCSLPGVCMPRQVAGRFYYDGGVADPIPYKKAFADGCNRLVVLLTRPVGFRRSPQKHMGMMKWLLRKYPQTAAALAVRYERYNTALDELQELEKTGKVLILAPDDISGMKTLTTDPEIITGLYQKGYADAAQILTFFTQFDEQPSEKRMT